MSLKKLVARIEAENEIFDSLSKAEKRVRIAQDCLERINLNLINPNQGSFLRVGTIEVLSINNDLKTSINSNIQCSACAKGSLFLSYVGRVNNFKTSDLDLGNKIYDNKHQKLLEIFTTKQLALIEYAFEGYQFISCVSFPVKTDKRALNFYYRYSSEDDRLIAICENIIKNEGTFKP